MSVDKISELWLKIDGLHIKHLEAEETPAKQEIRKRLEGYVTEYLNLVPHDCKFLSIRTGDIILHSARWIHGFSLTKAASAFLAIERYAANLINQPWRQEFWSIKQYSGFYRDSFESSLSGVEKFFYDMGYREIDPYCMDLSGTKQYGNPVNVDAVTSVARDCLLASVECNILADIHDGVSLQFQITMKELLEFRQDHIGTAEKAIQELIYRKNQTRYILNPGFIPFGYPGLPGNIHYRGIGHQFHLPGFSQENPCSITSTLRRGQISTTIIKVTGESSRGKACHKLDAVGYSKDKAERTNILNLQGTNRGSAENKAPTLQGQIYTSKEVVVTDEAMKNLTTLGFGKMDSGCYMGFQVEIEGRRDSSKCEHGDRKADRAVSLNKYSSTVGQEDGQNRSIKQIGQRETPQRTEAQNHQKTGVESPEGNFWKCRICTFHNLEDNTICEICGKTTDQGTTRKSQIDAQNYVGGLICDKCTLLNEEAAKICEACGATLGMVYSPVRPTSKNNREALRRMSQREFPPLC